MANDTGSLMDVAGTLARLDGDEFLLGEIARIFITTAPDELNVLGAALESGDTKTAYHQAHSLKGSVGAFEAPTVLKAIVDIEQQAKAGDGAAAAAAFPAARELVEALMVELGPLVQADSEA